MLKKHKQYLISYLYCERFFFAELIAYTKVFLNLLVRKLSRLLLDENLRNVEGVSALLQNV